MIEAKDLSIGCLVYDRGGRVLRIDYMDKHKVYQEMFVNEINVHPLSEYYTRIEPIQVTEDLLRQAGFKKQGKRYSKNWFFLWEDNGNIVFALEEMHSQTGTYLIIKSVHQLQILYRALTGEDLSFLNT